MANADHTMSSAPDPRERDASGAADAPDRKRAAKSGQDFAIDRPARPHDLGDDVIEFGTFRVLPYQRQLYDGQERVQIGSRAFDLLLALLSRPGALLTKKDLIAQVWPNTFVDECNLRVTIVALRKVLRDRDARNPLIVTVNGGGYRFVAPVTRAQGARRLMPVLITDAASAKQLAIELPGPRTPMFGRTEFVSTLIAQMLDCRTVTIVGPGGIGKTRVAAATAELLAETHPVEISFVDLTTISDAARVPGAIAGAIGIDLPRADPIGGLVGCLRDRLLGRRGMLLVLDNCERMVDATADLIERLSGAPGLNILATSREPLRFAGEYIRKLPPLHIPDSSEQLTAASSVTYPAVQLFADRAHTAHNTFTVTDGNARLIADICCQLDGIPLAIELAARTVMAFGLKGLATQLDQPFRLRMNGLRTAHPRHRNLAALLDWSYDTLSESERAALRRLAIFPGPFTLKEACAVITGSTSDRPCGVEEVMSLLSKSLIASDFSASVAPYRLLGTTRVYAHGKLAASGELKEVEQRHTALAARASSFATALGQHGALE